MKEFSIRIGVKQLVALGVILLLGFVFSDWNVKRFGSQTEAWEASEKWRTSGIPYAVAIEPSVREFSNERDITRRSIFNTFNRECTRGSRQIVCFEYDIKKGENINFSPFLLAYFLIEVSRRKTALFDLKL